MLRAEGLQMRAPSEAHIVQLVQIQPKQRLATSSEQNLTYREVTNCAKLKGWMHQAVTQVNVLSPEITIIVEVDAFHSDGRRNCYLAIGDEIEALPGSEAMA
jgi:hypothetical protein